MIMKLEEKIIKVTEEIRALNEKKQKKVKELKALQAELNEAKRKARNKENEEIVSKIEKKLGSCSHEELLSLLDKIIPEKEAADINVPDSGTQKGLDFLGE